YYLLTTVVQGQDAGLPGEYLNFAGYRAVGMGRAYVGLAEGTDAVPWNAAGLGLLRPNTLSLLHTRTVENFNLEYISYAQPLYRWGGLGLSFVRLDSGALAQTDELNRETGSFRDVQETFMVGYGFTPFTETSSKGFIQRISLGTTFKYSQQKLAQASAKGMGMDMGTLLNLRYGLSLGLRIQNALPTKLKFETGTDEFPRVISTGFASRLFRQNLVLTADVDKAIGVTQKIKWRMGAEATLWQIAKLRGGFDFNRKEFTFGLGYIWGRYGLDYASSGSEIGLSHRFGISYSFGGYPVAVEAYPQAFSPVGMKKTTTLSVQINHSQRIFSWALDIRNQNRDLIRSIRGSGQPPSELVWDGTTEKGTMVPAGNYTYTLTVTDAEGRQETTPPQVVRVNYGTPLDTLELQSR
ncbi:MAG: PorV/PorQ family protein, partial [Elusimicrobia bacterium]|nr:PorV/PorQ family protein [Elusimicrobiota bacterium]